MMLPRWKMRLFLESGGLPCGAFCFGRVFFGFSLFDIVNIRKRDVGGVRLCRISGNRSAPD